MGQAVTGVGILATDGPGGRFGLTVSSMASVCAEPPMLLVCVRANNPCVAAIRANASFSLSLLHSSQAHLADGFAGRPRNGNAYDFEDTAWRSQPAGQPHLHGASASFICSLESSQVVGSHIVLIGRVAACTAQGGAPLLYCARRYGLPAAL